jgi:hypothetical protein
LCAEYAKAKIIKPDVFRLDYFRFLIIILAAELFLHKILLMEVRKKSKGLYWLLFFVSTAALVLAIALHWPWLTLILPFVTTFFVLAMDII